MKPFLCLLSICCLSSQTVQAQVLSRLKAWSYTQGILIDSAHYTYSSGRGGSLAFNTNMVSPFYHVNTATILFNNMALDNDALSGLLNYDEAVNITRVAPKVGYPYYQKTKSILTYDAQNRVATSDLVQYDTVSNTWLPHPHHYTYIYGGPGTLTDVITTESGINKWRKGYDYDAQGRLTFATYYTYHASKNDWDPMTREAYEYDNNNRVSKYANQMRDINYNWSNSTAQTFTYTPQGRLESMGTSVSKPADKQLMMQYTTSGDTTIITMDQWDMDKKNWFLSSVFKEVRDNKGRMILAISSSRGASPNNIMNTLAHKWNYNNYNQVTEYVTFHPTTPGKIVDHYRFYYETYLTGISAETGNVMLSIYPSPASNNLHLELTLFDNTKKIEAVVTDMAGRTCNRWSFDMQGSTSLQKDMSIANLSPGIYFLRIQSGDDKVITKRFTVAR